MSKEGGGQIDATNSGEIPVIVSNGGRKDKLLFLTKPALGGTDGETAELESTRKISEMAREVFMFK